MQELAYDPWGAVEKDTNPGFQPFGFAGGVEWALPFPGRNNLVDLHVEAHTAQIMRIENLESATLRINQVPCTSPNGCATMLPHMLPEGARLRVLGPGGFDQTFVGLPDPPGYP